MTLGLLLVGGRQYMQGRDYKRRAAGNPYLADERWWARSPDGAAERYAEGARLWDDDQYRAWRAANGSVRGAKPSWVERMQGEHDLESDVFDLAGAVDARRARGEYSRAGGFIDGSSPSLLDRQTADRRAAAAREDAFRQFGVVLPVGMSEEQIRAVIGHEATRRNKAWDNARVDKVNEAGNNYLLGGGVDPTYLDPDLLEAGIGRGIDARAAAALTRDGNELYPGLLGPGHTVGSASQLLEEVPGPQDAGGGGGGGVGDIPGVPDLKQLIEWESAANAPDAMLDSARLGWREKFANQLGLGEAGMKTAHGNFRHPRSNPWDAFVDEIPTTPFGFGSMMLNDETIKRYLGDFASADPATLGGRLFGLGADAAEAANSWNTSVNMGLPQKYGMPNVDEIDTRRKPNRQLGMSMAMATGGGLTATLKENGVTNVKDVVAIANNAREVLESGMDENGNPLSAADRQEAMQLVQLDLLLRSLAGKRSPEAVEAFLDGVLSAR